jgi:hypothetical protein
MMVTETLQVEVGEHLTHNVQPLLHEIRHALATLLDDGGNTVIDLRSLPLAPGLKPAIPVSGWWCILTMTMK